MFDRIAGRYDALNSVMTAGLHHRWRERAADRAELRPGDSALDVCCGTGDLALELARRVAPGGQRRRLRLLRADARPGAREGGAARRRAGSASSGPTPSSSPTTRAASTPSRSASASATSPTSTAACARWPACCAPAAAWSSSRSPSRRRPPLSTFYSLWFDRVVPVLGALAGDSEAYSYLPESVRSFPDPHGLADKMDAAGLERHPLHGPRRRDHRDPQRRPRRDAAARPSRRRSPRSSTPRAAGCRPGWARWRRCLREQSGGHGEPLAGDAGATLAAGGKRLRPLLVLLCGGAGQGGDAAVRAADRDRAGPHGDPRPRRRARRRAAAPRAADRRRHLRPRPRGRDRRPALLPRLRAAGRGRRRAAPSSCSARPRSRSPAASWPSATTPSTPRSPSSATWSAAA